MHYDNLMASLGQDGMSNASIEPAESPHPHPHPHQHYETLTIHKPLLKIRLICTDPDATDSSSDDDDDEEDQEQEMSRRRGRFPLKRMIREIYIPVDESSSDCFNSSSEATIKPLSPYKNVYEASIEPCLRFPQAFPWSGSLKNADTSKQEEIEKKEAGKGNGKKKKKDRLDGDGDGDGDGRVTIKTKKSRSNGSIPREGSSNGMTVKSEGSSNGFAVVKSEGSPNGFAVVKSEGSPNGFAVVKSEGSPNGFAVKSEGSSSGFAVERERSSHGFAVKREGSSNGFTRKRRGGGGGSSPEGLMGRSKVSSDGWNMKKHQHQRSPPPPHCSVESPSSVFEISALVEDPPDSQPASHESVSSGGCFRRTSFAASQDYYHYYYYDNDNDNDACPCSSFEDYDGFRSKTKLLNTMNVENVENVSDLDPIMPSHPPLLLPEDNLCCSHTFRLIDADIPQGLGAFCPMDLDLDEVAMFRDDDDGENIINGFNFDLDMEELEWVSVPHGCRV